MQYLVVLGILLLLLAAALAVRLRFGAGANSTSQTRHYLVPISLPHLHSRFTDVVSAAGLVPSEDAPHHLRAATSTCFLVWRIVLDVHLESQGEKTLVSLRTLPDNVFHSHDLGLSHHLVERIARDVGLQPQWRIDSEH